MISARHRAGSRVRRQAHRIWAFRRLLAPGVDRDWRRRRACRHDGRAALRLGPRRPGRSGRLDLSRGRQPGKSRAPLAFRGSTYDPVIDT